MPAGASHHHDTAGFPVGVVAERLGIPTATLRSWNQRYGIGPGRHQPGRHRLYSERDIAVLERMLALIRAGNSPAGAALAIRGASLTLGDHQPLLRAAFAFDTVAVTGLLRAHISAFGVVDTWDRVCRPAFGELIGRYGSGEGCADIEHLLTWCTISVLHHARPAPEGAAPARVVLACTSGEHHSLPLEVLRAGLAENLVAAHTLGPDLPTRALSEVLARLPRGVLVVLWSQRESTALAAAVDICDAAGARVYLAGPGWDAVVLPSAPVRLVGLADAIAHLS